MAKLFRVARLWGGFQGEHFRQLLSGPRMSTEQFPEKLADEIKYYVYRLIDPRNGQTFYVGKGKGNRVFMHAQGVEHDPG